MVHAYEGVDWNVVETAAFVDVPQLVIALEAAAAEHDINLTEDRDA